jgi:uncharacterized membrane protein YjdF
MILTRRELPVAIVNLIYISAFTLVALRRSNYEFLLYAFVVAAAAMLILWLHQTYRFTLGVLWGLTLWGVMHMAGGNIDLAGGRVLYELQLVPTYLRYDQLVHGFGFGVVTLVCYQVLRHFLRPDVRPWWPLAVLVALMGSGMGAMNEIVEFIAVKTMPQTNVGGYDNTLWDLVFNLLGGVIAVIGLSLQRAGHRGRAAFE